MKYSYLFACLLAFAGFQSAMAQPDRWQQGIAYDMDIDFDVENHQFSGTSVITYHNNSPDALDKVFFHLYFNAFQPNSMMDVRSRTIADPDRRVGDRILGLSEDEIGYQRVRSLTFNGQTVDFETVGTILEVTLPEPIAPESSAVFEMEYDAQVPVQIRRSGRNNAEGVDYSMAQWYPKMCEYDYQGWHANPYIAREFYGVWGDFDVSIRIDADYTIGATGYLTNAEAIGHGYAGIEGMGSASPEDGKLTWHFSAPNVHDFVWAADSDYRHITLERDNGMVIHCFFLDEEEIQENWEKLPGIMDRAFAFINTTYGEYPYEKYSFIQGGDGGMEYPMATLITGGRSLVGLVSVSVHELMHSWYQMALGTNESLYPWMDEGFTSRASAEVMNHLRAEGLIPGEPRDNPHIGTVNSYIDFTKTGLEEPMSTHSDHYFTNAAYSRAAYTKGAVFLTELEYVMGKEDLDQGMREYYNTWKFKHPNPNDFIRIMEKRSGLELDWFKEYWVYSTRTVDYAVHSVEAAGENTAIELERIGLLPMPIDLEVVYRDGTRELFTIPLRIMRGAKTRDTRYEDPELKVLADWPWTHPSHTVLLDKPLGSIQSVTIDPSLRLADVDRENNVQVLGGESEE